MKFLEENYHNFLFVSAIFFLGNPAKFPADDGFFYPQIAYNFVHYGFLGFNDLYQTNGFHPLWMVFCVLSELLNPLDKIFVLNILWLFQVVFIFFGFKLLEDTYLKDSKTGRILSLAFYCLMFFSLGTLYLTEAHLAFFTLALLLYFCCKNYTNDFLFGLICSLVFLARLDHIFIVIPFGFWFWKQKRWNIVSLIKMLVGFSFLSIPYLVSNQFIFGSLVPISGKIKSSFPLIQSYIEFGTLQKIFTGIGFLYFLFLIFVKDVPNRIIKLVFLSGSLLHLFYNLFFQSAIGQWYFVSQMIFCGFFINDCYEKLNFKAFTNHYTTKVLAILSIVFLCVIGWLKLTTSLSLQNNVFAKNSKFEKKPNELVRETTLSLGKILPANSRIYIYDFPGKFAFYSNFNIIPADGLVANLNFFEQINSDRFPNFLKMKKIDYMLFPTHFQIRDKTQGFMGIDINNVNADNVIYLRNTLDKKIVDSLDEKDLVKIKSYPNPIKTWQPQYDSVTVYRLK